MNLNEEHIMNRAAEIHRDAAWEDWISEYETMDGRQRVLLEESFEKQYRGIRSSQVKAVVKAIVEAINNQKETDAQAILRRTI